MELKMSSWLINQNEKYQQIRRKEKKKKNWKESANRLFTESRISTESPILLDSVNSNSQIFCIAGEKPF